jgi:sec-independent protein translocase protein TatA
MDLGVPELIIIAVLIILLFGVGRIGKVGGELGKGIREFRTAIREDDPANTAKKEAETPAPAPTTPAVAAPAVTTPAPAAESKPAA